MADKPKRSKAMIMKMIQDGRHDDLSDDEIFSLFTPEQLAEMDRDAKQIVSNYKAPPPSRRASIAKRLRASI